MGRALAIWLGALAGCGPSQFACRDADDCRDGDRQGTCEATGVCSFADPSCASGRRYGSHAGELAGACVEDATGSSGVDTVSTGTSTTGSSGGPPGSTSSGPDASTTGMGSGSGAGETLAVDGSTGIQQFDTLVWLTFDDEADPWHNLGSLGDPSCAGGCPTITAAQGSGRATFDGVDDCLVLEAPMLSLPRLSVMAWIRGGVGDGINTAVGKPLGDSFRNSFAIFWQGAGASRTLRAAINAADAEISLVLPSVPAGDAWFHIALVFDGANASLYLDGSELAGPSPGGMDVDTWPIYIGCDDDHTGELMFHMPADVDELRIYDRALGAAEIAEIASQIPPV